MSRYKTREHYERNHLRTCARCGRWAGKAANWSDGPICRTCLDRALRIRGRCPGCGTDRLLPGRDQDAIPICRDCAGITRSFFCDRCGFEGRLHTGRLCERCTLTDKVTAALDDGTGRVSPALQPLADHLIGMPDPWKGWMWLRHPGNHDLLSGLATGGIPLSHEAFHTLPNWRTAGYLRDLLMACGVLPAIDKQLLHCEALASRRLTELDDHPHIQILRRFITWHELPALRTRARRRALTPSTTRAFGEHLTQALAFLTWLDTCGKRLDQCQQADIDAWHATHPWHQQRDLRNFLTWATTNQIMSRSRLPKLQGAQAAPLSQHKRLELIRRAITDEQIPLRARVTACLVLLYGQPITRITRLTIDDLSADETGTMLLHLGDPPTPVPETFATLLTELIGHRENMTTATNPHARWIFPGRRADQPLNPSTLREQLCAHGFHAATARPAALRQLVLQAPAPVIATALGYHHITTTRHAAQAGTTWNTYAPGDHST